MSNNTLFLDLPTEYKFVVLSNKNPDQQMLKTLYNNLLSPNFPHKDHLESYDNFQYYLNPPVNSFWARSHIIIIERQDTPVACLILEFYPISNCGLASYLVVDEKYRGKKLANYLMSKAKQILFLENDQRRQDFEKQDLGSDNYSLLKQYLKKDNNKDIFEILMTLRPLLFLETEKEDDHDPIMDPKVRLMVYDKMGFKKIPFCYRQPNLSENQKSVSLYLMVSTDLAHRDEQGDYIDSNSIQIFIWEFAQEVSPKFFATQEFTDMRSSIKDDKSRL